jgi:hypothetical protein
LNDLVEVGLRGQVDVVLVALPDPFLDDAALSPDYEDAVRPVEVQLERLHRTDRVLRQTAVEVVDEHDQMAILADIFRDQLVEVVLELVNQRQR